MSKKVETVAVVISLAIFAWFGASFVDVISHNMTTNVYQWWNFFNLF